MIVLPIVLPIGLPIGFISQVNLLQTKSKTSKKRPQAPTHILLGLKSEKSGNQVPNSEKHENYIKDAPKQTVQNGSYAFPNELMRFPNEAKPIWVKIQKHCKMQS